MSTPQANDPPVFRPTIAGGRKSAEGETPVTQVGREGAMQGRWEKAKVLTTAADALARVLELVLRH